MNTIRLTMAQALVRFLDQQYVEFDGLQSKFVEGIWGIFGHGNVTGLGEALENEQHDLKFIQGHNEQGMVHAATAFAKQNKRLKIMACTSSIGPGALNMVTGAGTATTNRLPVLLLPGDIFACRQPDPVLQQLEHPMDGSMSVNDCFKPVSQYWDRILRPEQLMSACLNAMRVLTDPCQTGAVTLCLPQDVQAEAFDYPESFFERRVHVIERMPVHEATIDNAVQTLVQAKNPLIIAGGGVVYSQAGDTLMQFAEQFKIPVAVTQAGKGVMLDEHPFSVGGIGVTGTQVANQLAKQTDVVLALGTRLSDFTTASKSAFEHPNLKIIHVNVNGLDGTKMNGAWIRGDVQSALIALKQSLIKSNYSPNQHAQTMLHDLQSNWQLERQRVISQESTDGLSQCAVLGVLNEVLGQDDIIVSAAGSLPGDLHRLWQVKGEGTYHLEYAFSCMGYEVAGALGVKMAHPNREVYVLVGDGSFLMMHSELLTSLQENMKINVIVFDNQGYQCIQGLQKAHGSAGFGNEFTKPVRYAELAQALGVESHYVSDLKSLRDAWYKAKQSKVSTLIELKVSPTSMSQGYDTWWRVGVAQTSTHPKVTASYEKMQQNIEQAQPF